MSFVNIFNPSTVKDSFQSIKLNISVIKRAFGMEINDPDVITILFLTTEVGIFGSPR